MTEIPLHLILCLTHYAYVSQQLTTKKRMIKIANMLTRVTDVINTCKEETINEIRGRYVEYNEHGQSYIWKVTDPRSISSEYKSSVTLFNPVITSL